MSRGHHSHEAEPPGSELDDLLDHALADAKVRAQLARPYRVITRYDIPLVGSSGVGWYNIYFDRHLHSPGLPYGFLLVDGKRLDVRPGLLRHERLEPVLENVYGWPYLPLAHFTAQRWEERYYRDKGFDPASVEKAFRPLIKKDDHERIQTVPTDLDMRPLFAPPKSTALIQHIKEIANKEKKPQASVRYTNTSPYKNRRCGNCVMFVEEEFGGPGCTKVRDPIVPEGWCKLYFRGQLRDARMGNESGAKP